MFLRLSLVVLMLSSVLLIACGDSGKHTKLRFDFTGGQARLECQAGKAKSGSGGFMLQDPDASCRIVDGMKSLQLPSKSRTCPGAPASVNRVKIVGTLQGKRVDLQLQQGPCIQAVQAWNQWSELWNASATVQSKMQKIFVVPIDNQTPVIKQKPPGKVLLDCERSLSINPLYPCVRSVPVGQPDALTIRLTGRQIRSLIGMPLGQIKTFLQTAQYYPVPAGYPGYVGPTTSR